MEALPPSLNAPGARPRGAAWLFPVMLWAFALFFLLGDIGKWNDDWFYIQRAPETGEIRAWYLEHPLHFWRPLYKLVVPTLATVLWKHDQINHLISAGVHGINALLLWRLLGLLGVRRLAAAVAGLFFLVFPAAYEVPLWLCALPSGLSTMLTLGAMLLVVAYARGRVGNWAGPAVGGIAFAAAAFNEQPICAAAALPVVYLAAMPVGERWGRAVVRSLLPAVCAGAALAVYVAIHRKLNTAPTTMGHESFVAPLSELWLQPARIAGWVKMQFFSADFARRAGERAGEAFAAHPLRTAGFAAALVGSGAMWTGWQVRHGHERAELRPEVRPARWWMLGLLGLAIFVAGWIPIAAFNYWLNSRVAYVPVMGVAVLLSAAGSLGAEGVGEVARARRSRLIVSVVAACAFVGMGVVLVGIQRGYQLRYLQDLREVAQLRALAPEPPEGAVFAPVRVAFPTEHPRHARFERYFSGVFNSWWGSQWILRLEYRRSDLLGGDAQWEDSSLLNPTRDSVRLRECGRKPWEVLIPFEIDREGNVSLITHIDVERGGALAFTKEMPATSALPVPRRTFTIRQ